MARFRVSVSLTDGTTESAEGELAPLADRVAFERRFGVSAVVMQGLDAASPDPAVLREEWIAFLVWRLMMRRGATMRIDFESWLESLEGEISLEELEAVPLVRTAS